MDSDSCLEHGYGSVRDAGLAVAHSASEGSTLRMCNLPPSRHKCQAGVPNRSSLVLSTRAAVQSRRTSVMVGMLLYPYCPLQQPRVTWDLLGSCNVASATKEVDLDFNSA